MPEKFEVTIYFGQSEQVKKEYSFATEAELNAFLLGVDESNGYLEYSFEADEDEEDDEN